MASYAAVPDDQGQVIEPGSVPYCALLGPLCPGCLTSTGKKNGAAQKSRVC